MLIINRELLLLEKKKGKAVVVRIVVQDFWEDVERVQLRVVCYLYALEEEEDIEGEDGNIYIKINI